MMRTACPPRCEFRYWVRRRKIEFSPSLRLLVETAGSNDLLSPRRRCLATDPVLTMPNDQPSFLWDEPVPPGSAGKIDDISAALAGAIPARALKGPVTIAVYGP